MVDSVYYYFLLLFVSPVTLLVSYNCLCLSFWWWLYLCCYTVIPTSYFCWECQSIINKFYKFKLQAADAQYILRTNSYIQNSLSKLSSTTINEYNYEFQFVCDPLTYHGIDNIKIENIDINELSDIDTKSIELNTTSIDEDTRNVDIDTTNVDTKVIDTTVIKPTNLDELSNNAITTDIKINRPPNTAKLKIEQFNKRKGKEKIHENTKERICKELSKENSLQETVDQDDYSGVISLNERKFEEVYYTESELQKIREDKRSHPNYKKLPYKCNSCVLGFMRKEKYDSHMNKSHSKDSGEHQCSVCEVRFQHKQTLNKHRSRHFSAYKCCLCACVTSELWAAIRHERTKHKEDSYCRIHCTECRVVVKTKEELKQHMEENHVLYCNDCGERFKTKACLRTHIRRTHSSKREYICNICTRTFVRRSLLESHVIRHGDAVAKRMSYCTVCNVQFKNIYVYRGHLRRTRNHSEKLYPCPDCKKKFLSKSYMQRHYDFYHLRKSSFKCESCNKLFMSKWRLTNHKQVHHGLKRPRNHACNICGKKFYTVSFLREHVLIHNAERTFMCEECGDTFKQRAALYTHNKLVHNTHRKAQ